MDINMDFSIATASKNMTLLLSQKTAMWNKQFDAWINGWMDGLIDWITDWLIDDWLID